MGIDRCEMEEGGRALMKTRFNYSRDGAAQVLKHVPVEILEILGTRGARIRRLDNQKCLTVTRNELEPDHDWLTEQEAKEAAKRERLRQERLALAEATGIRDPIESEPPAPSLRATLGDFMKLLGNGAAAPSDGPNQGDTAEDVAKAFEIAQGIAAGREYGQAEDIERKRKEAEELAELERELEELERQEAAERAAQAPREAPRTAGPSLVPGWSSGAAIKALRERSNLSNKALQELVGTKAPAHIWMWEANKCRPQGTYLAKLCEVFGVGEGVILGREPIPADAPMVGPAELPESIARSRKAAETMGNRREPLQLVADIQREHPVASKPTPVSPPVLDPRRKLQPSNVGKRPEPGTLSEKFARLSSFDEGPLPTADSRRTVETVAAVPAKPKPVQLEITRPEPTPPAALSKPVEADNEQATFPSFDMWAEMGKRMQEPLRSELATIDAALTPIDEQIAALEQRKKDLSAKRVDVQEQLGAIQTMLARRGKG